MIYGKTIKPNETQNEEHYIACSECIGETCHKVLQSIDVCGRQRMGEDCDYFGDDKFQNVQCQGCNSISFRKYHTDSEDEGYDKGENYRGSFRISY